MSAKAVASSAAEDPDAWLFDFILSFIKSPVFTVPLLTFIDENSLVFDGEGSF